MLLRIWRAVKEGWDTNVDNLLYRPEVARAKTAWRRKLAAEARREGH
jgi:hypothetical protein